MKHKRPKPVFGKQKEIKVSSLDGNLPVTDGWNEFKKAIPISAAPEMFVLMKQAYFAGGLGLYTALMLGLDEGTGRDSR